MTVVTVSEEQARLISEATTPIVFVDVSERKVGTLEPLAAPSNSQPSISDEELAELKRRLNSPGPGKTTKELLDHLKAIAPIETP
jgi:hypothetical protein